MKRLFFGLAVDPDVGERILRAARAALDGRGDYRVYAPEDLHVTLAFLGVVADERVDGLVRAADLEFRALHAPELGAGSCGDAFPSCERPRALFTCVSEDGASLGRLAALRNRALQAGLSTGWRPPAAERQRPFRPHVTLARTRGDAPVPEAFRDLDRERHWVPVDAVLFESLAERAAGGPRYRCLASWPLAVDPG